LPDRISRYRESGRLIEDHGTDKPTIMADIAEHVDAFDAAAERVLAAAVYLRS
jgi:hypothetical protein